LEAEEIDQSWVNITSNNEQNNEIVN